MFLWTLQYICLASAVLLERQYLLILTLRFNAQYVSGILTTCMDMHGAALVYIFCFLFSSCRIRNISNIAKDQTISSGHHACSKARSSTTGQKRIMRQQKNQTIGDMAMPYTLSAQPWDRIQTRILNIDIYICIYMYV